MIPQQLQYHNSGCSLFLRFARNDNKIIIIKNNNNQKGWGETKQSSDQLFVFDFHWTIWAVNLLENEHLTAQPMNRPILIIHVWIWERERDRQSKRYFGIAQMAFHRWPSIQWIRLLQNSQKLARKKIKTNKTQMLHYHVEWKMKKPKYNMNISTTDYSLLTSMSNEQHPRDKWLKNYFDRKWMANILFIFIISSVGWLAG